MNPANRIGLLEMLPKQSVGAEIGVELGRFSRRIIQIVQPRVLYLIDSWENPADQVRRETDEGHIKTMRLALRRVKDVIATGQVRPICEFSVPAAALLQDGELDWVYIDAGHTYQECLADLEAYYPKVKSGGIVAGHDFTEPSTWVGVPQAVREFTAEKGVDFSLTTDRRRTFWFYKP